MTRSGFAHGEIRIRVIDRGWAAVRKRYIEGVACAFPQDSKRSRWRDASRNANDTCGVRSFLGRRPLRDL